MYSLSTKQCLVIVVSLALLVAGAGPVAAGNSDGHDGGDVNGVTEIDGCAVIDEPGEYVLTDDIEDSDADVCIDIRSSDVRFDGDGHTVDGVQTEETLNESGITEAPVVPFTSVGVGVNIDEEETVSDVTVMDVIVTDWIYGVAYQTTDGGMVEETTVSNNGVGIVFERSNDGTIAESTAENNFINVVIDSLSGEVVSGNTVTDTTATNGELGIGVFNASDTTIEDSTTNENFFGILAVDRVDGTTISGSTADNNAFGGIGAGEAADITIADSSASENGYVGIALINTTESMLSGNDVSDTRGEAPFPATLLSTGYLLDNASESVVVGNTATGNAANGIALVNESDTNLLLANDASENGADGFNVNGSENVALIVNTATDNADDGIEVTDSDRVLLLLNELAGNGDQAVEVNDSENVLQIDSLADLEALLGESA